MKADLSRDTFSSRRHYSAVLMQQGRVQMDADWNEQQAINRHRIETEAQDLIGASGGGVNGSGFEIGVHEGTTLSIGPGNLYVDGILCQNEASEDGESLLFENQLPGRTGEPAIEAFMQTPQVGLVYLDVWERHLTALDDDRIREVALGGPDTAARAQTAWRVRVLPVEAGASDADALEALLEARVAATDEAELARINARILGLLGVGCASSFGEEMGAENPPSTGELVARTLPPASAESPCVLPPGAGFERLENQLYRVEIHDKGDRGDATFKWSRDNGSVATAVLGVARTTGGAEVSVRDLGRDDTLGFAVGQYVELVGDDRELAGLVEPLARISSVDPAARTITVDVPFSDVDPQDARELHYKLRRWDSAGVLEMPGERFAELEGGVEVKFREGHYNTGDYWLIPARTATGTIEWPEDQAQPPAGVHHHYARLALVLAATVGEEERLLVLADCRRLFPSLTELTSFFYAGGDGQEVLPAGPNQPGARLPQPLRAGVANGQWPVAGARVRFATTEDLTNGRVESEDGRGSGTSLTVLTGPDGVAECYWRVDGTNPDQQVTATLLDDGGATLHLPIRFGASLSLAGEVSYTPGEVCANLEGVTTVQEALDELCKTGDNVPGIVIEGVLTLDADASPDRPLPHDANVPAPVLARGLRVVCSEPVDEEALGDRFGDKRTCFVSLDLPYPINDADRSLWDIRSETVLGYQRLILSGSVRVDGASIVWEPADDDTRRWLSDALFAAIRERFPEIRRIQTHLTLKGNFIWAREDRFRFLDGETFGTPATERDAVGLDLPSGDLRRGGDFEMWFWLETGSVEVDAVTLTSSSITGGGDVTGGVVLSREAESGTRIALSSNNPAVVFLNSQGQPVGQNTVITVASGQNRGGFGVRTSPVLAARSVTITAQREGSSEEPKPVVLSVQPPRPVNLFLNPSRVAPGGQSTGTVILDGAAPPASVGALRLTLSCGDRTVATVPNETDPLPPGTTQVSFPITAVASAEEEFVIRDRIRARAPFVRTATITASFAKTSATATLTVEEEGKFFVKPEFEFPFPEERFLTRSNPEWTADRPEEPDRPSESGEPFVRPEERPEPPPPEPPNG